jgi:hypothetical protein
MILCVSQEKMSLLNENCDQWGHSLKGPWQEQPEVQKQLISGEYII